MKTGWVEYTTKLTRSNGQKPHRARKNLRFLIKKLEAKAEQLNQQLQVEGHSGRRSRLRTEILVLAAQQKKGLELLRSH